MASLRDLGYKIYSLILDDTQKEDGFCRKFNLTESDYKRLITGNLMVSIDTIKDIADFFSINVEDIVYYKNDDNYKLMVHCRGSFSSRENCRKILDMIDSYVDVKEVFDYNAN